MAKTFAVGPKDVGVSYEMWADLLMNALGISDTADNTRVLIVCWCQAEGTNATNNPMATTLVTKGSKQYPGVTTAAVQDYPSPQAGIAATASTLQESRYTNVLDAMKNDRDYVRTAYLVATSPWGTTNLPTVAAGVKASGGKNGAGYSAIKGKYIELGKWKPSGPGGITGWLQSEAQSIPGVSTVESGVSAIEQVKNAMDASEKFLEKLSDPHTWYRIGQVVLGAIFVAIGIYMLGKTSGVSDVVPNIGGSSGSKPSGGSKATATKVSATEAITPAKTPKKLPVAAEPVPA